MRYEYRGKTIKAVHGDITTVAADAIVNAANEGLRGGGGVDGAIHRAGGPAIMEECRKIGRCATGKAVITTAGNLPAKHVIHTVGPIWHGGASGEPAMLRNAYENSLNLADKHHLQSIAFPSISTGVYGYPVEKASVVAVEAVLDHLAGKTSLREVTFVLFSQADYDIYSSMIGKKLGATA